VFAGKSVRWEWRSPRTGRTYDLIDSPLRNPNGTISKLEIFHDITDRKQAEERLQHLQSELAHVDRLKIMGEMATGLAHELNQPLTAILMQAELAGRKLDLGRKLDTEELKKTWGQIADQAYRAGQIIRRMREFVRKSDPVQAPLDFGVLIEELLSLLRSDLRDHGIEITIDLASPLPKITADKIQVQQVLLNLARNAIEAMEDTPVEQRVLGIGAKIRDRSLEISVSDTGCGIPAGDSDKLFSAFHSTKSHGMGLGLAISRSIVERHGGHIWAEPNGDRGSIFMLTLPIAGVAQEV
jgi:C4-dicarboxylate-specific signal transduction histidine kinase